MKDSMMGVTGVAAQGPGGPAAPHPSAPHPAGAALFGLTLAGGAGECRAGEAVSLGALIEDAASRGAARALAELGLSDAAARHDMTELRELLGAWRDAKASARRAAISWLVRGCLALVLIGLAVKLGLTGLVMK